MDNLIQQQFETCNVRFVNDPTGIFEFGIVANDLAEVLEYAKAENFRNMVDDEYKATLPLNGDGGQTRTMTVIWEAGVYQALARSNKPKAKPFQKWLYEEVLPSIRKTGGYIDKSASDDKLDQLMQMLIDQRKEQNEKFTKLEQQNLLLLADKSEKELIGELITHDYEGISDLLKGVLGEIARHHGEEINAMYKLRPYYTLKEIALKFFPEDKVTDIVNKSRCNINGLYKSITKKLLPQERGNYQYDKINVIFALWRLYHCAKEIGMNVQFIDLENQTYIDSLEDLFEN